MSGKDLNEFVANLPSIDRRQYNHWRDWTGKLHNGDTKLTDLTDERSRNIGSFLYEIGQRTILNLREDRLDPNGNPYILCEDEVPDEDVLSSAKKEDIQRSFIRAFISESKINGLQGVETRAIDYSTSAVALASAMLNTSPAEIVGLLSSAIENILLNDKLGQVLQKSISDVSPNNIKQIVDYLKFSQTQLIKHEELFIKTGVMKEPEVNSAPFYLDGKEHVVASSLHDSVQIDPTLDKRDKEILVPLCGANHRSRTDMIEQAKLLAKQIFDINVDSRPPRWWVKKQSLQPIRSNEYLVYKPILSPEQIDSDIPHIFKFIESVNDNLGWYMIRTSVSESDGTLFISEAARMWS